MHTESKTRQNIELTTFALTWCANVFVGCSVTSTFFLDRSLPFLVLSIILQNSNNLYMGSLNYFSYTPNANMADHSVVAQDERPESEASQSSMFCFENSSPENSCFVVDLFCFISLCL